MNTLFPVEPIFPEGFTYYPSFLNVDEEAELMKEISKTELHNMHYHGYKANRKTASFGYNYSFDDNTLSKGAPIPPTFDWLINKTANYISVEKNKFAEMLITEYPPGAVIN